jgi:hypothetical protein
MSRLAAVAAVMAIGASSCVGLNGLPAAPDSETVADLLKIANECVAPEENGACAPANRVEKISIAAFDCEGLPVRAGMQEIRRARCVFEATATTAGGAAALAEKEAEFGLVNFALGSRIGQYRWVRTLPPKNSQPPTDGSTER